MKQNLNVGMLSVIAAGILRTEGLHHFESAVYESVFNPETKQKIKRRRSTQFDSAALTIADQKRKRKMERNTRNQNRLSRGENVNR